MTIDYSCTANKNFYEVTIITEFNHVFLSNHTESNTKVISYCLSKAYQKKAKTSTKLSTGPKNGNLICGGYILTFFYFSKLCFDF